MPSKRIPAYVNPKMLKWARERARMDEVYAAKRLGVSVERLQAWERGDLRPTILQALKMASLYRCPLSAFYLREPPKSFHIPFTDFRGLSGIGISPYLQREILEAQNRREALLDLLGPEEGIFEITVDIDPSFNPQEVGLTIRKALGMPLDHQPSWSSLRKAFDAWRRAIERQNVLVFLSADHPNSWRPEEAHGFTICERRLPVIVVNSHDSQSRQLFTLVHEFVHLLLKTSALCDVFDHPVQGANLVEVFCNNVAAQVLLPDSFLKKHPFFQEAQHQNLWKDETIEALAKAFSVSREMIVFRLYQYGLVTEEFYLQRRQRYIEEWRESRSSRGRGPAYPYRLKRRLGEFFLSQVFSAYGEQQITLTELSSLVGAKVPHVLKLEQIMAA